MNGKTPKSENPAFLTDQLITYLGNKRSLLHFIGEGIKRVQTRLGKKKLSTFDVFSGSGIVARYFKQFSRLLLVNDLEKYSAVINHCYLSNRDDAGGPLREYYGVLMEQLSRSPLEPGIIAGLYAPGDDGNIQRGERVFFTRRNALYIDTARRLIDTVPPKLRCFFLAPLLSEASIHANTAGVFKGFYKNRETGVGQFGGSKRDALPRITGEITLPFPVFSNFDSEVLIYREDSNRIIRRAPEVDLAYLDPPYNQHPYGSNYFMLNLIIENGAPDRVSAVSGIPPGWNRSDYNKKKLAYRALQDLVTHIRAKFVLLSFNSEGIIRFEEIKALLKTIGKVTIMETPYSAFKGSRNFRQRNNHVKEYLYLLEK
ncbi:MAG: DNA adenine methylase [Spirochaetaceae bacterium]|jgi:adenine-specific DNA-methyltransferase|nr:DNA adenine methylase [Spirochaetaceae bacterium]